MAPESYYFCFSLILVISSVLQLVSMVYFRIKGKTLYGKEYKKDTVEYGRLMKFANNRALAITITAVIGFVANLVYDLYRIAHLDNREYARTAPLQLSLFVLLICVVTFVAARKQINNYK